MLVDPYLPGGRCTAPPRAGDDSTRTAAGGAVQASQVTGPGPGGGTRAWVQRPRPTVPQPHGLLAQSLLGRGSQACGMLLWHGHQWGQGAGCAGRKRQRNAARPSRQQSEDHRALGLAGPPLWREGLCGSLMRPRHHSDTPPPPHPKLSAAPHLVTLPCPLLTVPLNPPAPPHTHAPVLTHHPMPSCSGIPRVCHLNGWAGTLGPVRSDLVLDARGRWSRGQIPGRHHPVVRWLVLQDCMGLP